MVSGARRPGAVLISALIGCLCLGCSSQPAADRGEREQPVAATVPQPAAAPRATDSEHSGPTPAQPATPAASSGRLSMRSFPRPHRLGPHWRYWIDPGDPEAGYLGNGTPALARDPAEFVATAVPLGCRRPAAMPTPDHVLEVDYRYADVKVVALRATFTAGQARQFFAARLANLRACLGVAGTPAEGPPVRRVRRVGPTAVVSDRTPDSPAPWTELALAGRRSVVLVAAQTPVGQPPMTHQGVRRIAAAFR